MRSTACTGWTWRTYSASIAAERHQFADSVVVPGGRCEQPPAQWVAVVGAVGVVRVSDRWTLAATDAYPAARGGSAQTASRTASAGSRPGSAVIASNQASARASAVVAAVVSPARGSPR